MSARTFFTTVIPAVFIFLLVGCGPVEIQGDITENVSVSVEEMVHRPWKAQVYVFPKESPQRPPTAVFFPFLIRQQIDSPDYYGREIGRFFWQEWLAQRVFPVFEYMEHTPWRGGDAAVAAARAKGADYAVGGEVTHMIAGGTLGETQLALRLYIYDAGTGDLVWSLAHSGQMKNRGMQDYVLIKKYSKMPPDPLYAVIRALAIDLSVPVNNWLNPIKREFEQKEQNQPLL